MTRVYIIVFVFIVSSFCLVAQRASIRPYDPSVPGNDFQTDLQHVEAYLEFFPDRNEIHGRVQLHMQDYPSPPDSIMIQAHAFTLNRLWLDGLETSFSQLGDVVKLPYGNNPSGRRILELHYIARPLSGEIFFLGWKDTTGTRRKQIWSHRPRGWLPYPDERDRTTVNLHITFDSAFKVFTNGERDSVTYARKGRLTWHYSMKKAHPFFSTALAIGEYHFLNRRAENGTPLELWYYPGWEDHIEPTYRYSERMFTFIETETGMKYPYSLYRQAPLTDYTYGAMETTTSTVFGDYLMVDTASYFGRNYVNVNCHELVHQWFGNEVSHLCNADVWLTESFATYYAKRFEREIFGENYYQNERHNERQRVFQAARHDQFPLGHSQGGVERWYPKGSLVLDMLRDELGEEGFRNAIRHYLHKHAESIVTTADFTEAVREATGKNLSWFWDQWVYRGGEPEIELEYSILSSGNLMLSLTQVHDTGIFVKYFRLPARIEVFYHDGSSTLHPLTLKGRTTRLELELQKGKEFSFVLFDPGHRLLRKLRQSRSLQMLSQVMQHAPCLPDRYEALLEMRNFPIGSKREILMMAWKKEFFHLTRNEVLSQLWMSQESLTEDFLTAVLSDPDDKVVLHALQTCRPLPENARNAAECCLNHPSVFVREAALDNLCFSFPVNVENYLKLTETDWGWRGGNIRMKWLEMQLRRNPMNPEIWKEVKEWISERFEFETRIRAMELAAKYPVADITLLKSLCQSGLYWHYKVRNAAGVALRAYMQNENTAPVLKQVIESFPPEEKKSLKNLCGI